MISLELKVKIHRSLEDAVIKYCDASNNCSELGNPEREEDEIIKVQRELQESELYLKQMVLYAENMSVTDGVYESAKRIVEILDESRRASPN